MSFSTVDDLKEAFVSQNLHAEMDLDVEPLHILILVELGNDFCGVPPEELNEATLNAKGEE